MAGRLLQIPLMIYGAALGSVFIGTAAHAAEPSAADYPSIQAAIDANPGRAIEVPSGDWPIAAPLRVASDGTTLFGFGRVVQSDPTLPIVRVEGAKRIRIRDLTLTRPEAASETFEEGLRISDCEDVEVVGVRILSNRTRSSALRVEGSSHVRIERCTIVDYKRVSIDDRTESELYGYAFRCIDGHGIIVERCRAVDLVGNTIREDRLLPTRELKEREGLGALVEGKRPRAPGPLGKGAVARGEAQNWHQGSAILVTGPEATADVQVISNRIENCAQGIDLHADRVLCAGNSIRGAMIGIKAMHGSRNLVVRDNQISAVDLWGILLAPGAASHAAEPAKGDRPARAANHDGGTIVSGNLITDFGQGHEYWNWGGASEDRGSSFAIRLDRGQIPENPPLSDVLIVGNLVQDSEKLGRVEGDRVVVDRPRYRYALHVEPAGAPEAPASPIGVRVEANLFDPGTDGTTNLPPPTQ